MIGASFDSTKTLLQDLLARAGVVAEAYDEGREDWDAEEPLEEAAS